MTEGYYFAPAPVLLNPGLIAVVAERDDVVIEFKPLPGFQSSAEKVPPPTQRGAIWLVFGKNRVLSFQGNYELFENFAAWLGLTVSGEAMIARTTGATPSS